MLNDRCDETYNRHMSEREASRIKAGRRHVIRWTPSTPGARHDYHDIETYLLAMAHGPGRMLGAAESGAAHPCSKRRWRQRGASRRREPRCRMDGRFW
jgi:hypothetical protein